LQKEFSLCRLQFPQGFFQVQPERLLKQYVLWVWGVAGAVVRNFWGAVGAQGLRRRTLVLLTPFFGAQPVQNVMMGARVPPRGRAAGAGWRRGGEVRLNEGGGAVVRVGGGQTGSRGVMARYGEQMTNGCIVARFH